MSSLAIFHQNANGCNRFPAQSVWIMFTALEIAGRARKASWLQVGGRNRESLVLALEQEGGVELEAGRRWSVTSHRWRTLWFRVEMSKEVVASWPEAAVCD